ncbi:hypothetical protein HYX13_04370 [Candidatus Woesearchaeota archaeon]|nr:hypothetical protein [Candidatus Woesearchaeota archaeon]
MTLSSVYGGAYFKSIPISLEEFEKSSYAKSDIFNRVSLEDELCNNGEIIEKLEEQRKSIEKQINERKIREKELGEEIHTGAMKEYTEIMKGTLPIQLSVKKIKTKEVNSKSGGDTSIRP